MKPLISVIIPSHNEGKTIGTAIQSMLDQSYNNLEIIIVDDNSKDNTKEIVSQFERKDNRIKYYLLPYDDSHRFDWRGTNINAGWMARNYGIEKAKGDWITFQDADDASLINRIEVQYKMAQKYNSSHVCIYWQKLNQQYLGKSFDVETFIRNNPDIFVSSKKILKLAKETKGHFWKIHQWIPFLLKTRGPLRFLFFKSWASYPCCAGAPMVKKEIVDKVKFRPRSKRIWPSKGGRGVDRDFNFQVAEKFKNSISLKLPLYLWRVKTQNPNCFSYKLEDFINGK